MKSKVVLFCVLLFCSTIVAANPHSEDLRQRVQPALNWQVDQNAQDTQYFDTEFTQTRNANSMTIPVIQQDSIQDYDSNQERYTSKYDGYGYNKSPVASPSGKQLLGNYNSQIDGRRLESYPPRVDSYPPQVGFDSQQFRNSNWRSQNPYTNSAPSGVLITDSERPLVNTVQESYRAPVQHPQPKYVPPSNREFYPPNRSYLRREQFKNPLTDDAGDGKYVANFAHRFASTGPVPFENFSQGQAGASEIKTRGGQRYLQNPAVIGDTLAAQSENIKFLENYSATSDLMNTGPLTNYDDGSPVMSKVENYSLDSRANNSPVSYESYNNGQDAASDMTARLTGSRRHIQSFALQSGIGYKESPAVISTDILKDLRIDRSRSDLSNAAHITNYGDDGSPDIYSSGSRLSNVHVPYEIYGEAQAAVSEVKLKPNGGQKYVQNNAPHSRPMYNNIPAVIASDNIVPATKQEDSSTVISAVDHTNTGSKPSKPTPENIEKKTPVDISKTLYNSASTVISETVEEKSGEKLVPTNKYSGTSSTSTNTESDVPALKSSSLIPTNTNLNHLKNQKSSSGITELSLIDLLSKTDIDKFMAGNTKRFLVIHPNKTVEYVDNIESNSHQNSKVHLLNKKPKNVIDSEGDGALLLDNVKDNPVDELYSNLPVEDLSEKHSNLKPLHPHAKQQVGSGSLKPLIPLSKPIAPLVNQEADKPLTFPENYPEKKNKYSKPFRPNSNPPFLDGNQLAVDKNFKRQHSNENQPSDENIFNSSSPDENQPSNDNNAKTLSSKENKSVGDNDFTPLSLRKRWLAHHHKNQPTYDYNSNPSSLDENQPENENNVKSSILNGNQSGDETDSNPLSPNEDQSGNDQIPKKRFMNENQSGDETDSNPLSPNEDQSGNDKIPKKKFMTKNQSEDDVDSKPSHSNKRHHKSKPSRIKQSANVDNSNLSYPDQNQPSDDDKPLYSYEIQPVQGNQTDIETEPKQQLSNENPLGDENDSNSSSPSENPLGDENDSNSSSPSENPLGDENDSNSSSPSENQTGDENDSNSSTLSENPLGDENDSNSSSPSENQPGDENYSKSSSPSENQTGDENDSNSSSPSENQPGDENDSNSSSQDENQAGDENDSNSSPLSENPLGDENDSNSSTLSENPLGDENDSNSSSPSENQKGDENDSNSSSPSDNQPGDEIDSNSSSPGENQAGDENDSYSSSPSKNQQVDDSNSNLSSSKENQPEDVNLSNPSYDEELEFSNANQSQDAETMPENKTGDYNNSDSLKSDENQLKDDNNAKPSDGKSKKSKTLKPRKRKRNNKRKPYENQSENDDNFPESITGDDNILNSSSPDENEPKDKKKSKRLRLYEKPTPPVLSKTDENPDSTTVSPTTPNYTALPKLQVTKKHKDRSIRRKSTTSSPIVTSTTPRLEETSEGQIITISPIEQVTDNVRDVSPVTTSTTTAKPIETSGESDTIKDDSNEQDANNANSSSEDLDSIFTPTENTSGDKTTKEIIEYNNIQTNDKFIKSQVSRKKKNIQTNTDAPAESDIYSPVTTSPSMQNDVNTGDASGDNILELEQPETDVTITISSNKDNDTEDDVIIINVEVSESTGSSSNDKSLLISIDTDDDNDDDSETSSDTGVDGQSSDSKKDHNDDDGKGKNLEIDMSNIQGEPTMWIRTTDQDFIEKLTEKKDTAFDIVYFYNMVTQPVIEREKETTFYCNGTVVITIKETTYPNEGDSTPNVEKKTETMQIEDYKQSGLEYSSD